jgi:hypothetical protein
MTHVSATAPVTAKTEITVKSNVASVGTMTIVVTKHGEHTLIKFVPAGVALTDAEKKAATATVLVSKKNNTRNRFRLPEDVAASLGLSKGDKLSLDAFDMGAWTPRARWARGYSRGGWFEVKVDDTNSALSVN